MGSSEGGISVLSELEAGDGAGAEAAAGGGFAALVAQALGRRRAAKVGSDWASAEPERPAAEELS